MFGQVSGLVLWGQKIQGSVRIAQKLQCVVLPGQREQSMFHLLFDIPKTQVLFKHTSVKYFYIKMAYLSSRVECFLLRSNLNSRGVNSCELFLVSRS